MSIRILNCRLTMDNQKTHDDAQPLSLIPNMEVCFSEITTAACLNPKGPFEGVSRIVVLEKKPF